MWPFSKKSNNDTEWKDRFISLYNYNISLSATLIEQLDPTLYEEIKTETADVYNSYQYLVKAVTNVLNRNKELESKVRKLENDVMKWQDACDELVNKGN